MIEFTQTTEQGGETELHVEVTAGEEHAATTAEPHNPVETAELSHEPTIFAEPLFAVGPLTVTNSLLSTWIAMAVIIVAAVALRVKLAKVPRGIQNAVEAVMEQGMEMANTITGDRHKTEKFFPIVFSVFLFILVNNWFGLLPGVGSFGRIESHEGHAMFVPFLRGGTADLNTTLAMAIIAVVISHLAGVFMIGFWHHLNKFINVEAIVAIPKKILKDPTILLVNPIKAFVGLIEIVGEGAKMASLSFRLFGNVFAGEVLLASMAALMAFVVPIPFIFLEIIVGLIQALIFAILTLVYMTIAASAEEH